MRVPSLTNNTAKTSSEDLVKISSAVAEHSRQKIKQTKTQDVS